MISPVDQDERDRAIAARGANLIVDAGAGTGKTKLIVDRLLEMVAPEDIPWNDLAFPVVRTALELHAEDTRRGWFHTHHGIITRDAAGSYPLLEHLALPLK